MTVLSTLWLALEVYYITFWVTYSGVFWFWFYLFAYLHSYSDCYLKAANYSINVRVSFIIVSLINPNKKKMRAWNLNQGHEDEPWTCRAKFLGWTLNMQCKVLWTYTLLNTGEFSLQEMWLAPFLQLGKLSLKLASRIVYSHKAKRGRYGPACLSPLWLQGLPGRPMASLGWTAVVLSQLVSVDLPAAFHSINRGPPAERPCSGLSSVNALYPFFLSGLCFICLGVFPALIR